MEQGKAVREGVALHIPGAAVYEGGSAMGAETQLSQMLSQGEWMEVE